MAGLPVVEKLTSLPIPCIAAVNGPAVGLGCSVVALSDIVYMGEKSFLADPHVQVGLVAADEVVFETDEVTEHDAWSVVVRGTARILTDPEETAKVDALGLKPWLRTEKLEYVEIAPDYITGRAFRLGD